MRATHNIVLASLNKGKIAEFRSLFQEFPELEFKSLPEIVFNVTSMKEAETGTTYYENAFNKGRLAFIASKYPTIGDDSGLEVDALKGQPGVFSDRYAVPKEGETKDAANIRKLLADLKGVPKEQRGARFVCTLVFFVEGIVVTATETMAGSILEAPRGSNGFGYDPVFLVKGTDRSFAEMTLEDKNRVSHRGKALRGLMAQVREKKIQLVRP